MRNRIKRQQIRSVMLILVLILNGIQPAWAETAAPLFFTGQKLKDLIESKGENKSTALGYIIGVMDGNTLTVRMNTAPSMKPLYNFCVPDKSNIGQAEAIVKKYLETHPETWHYPASGLILVALGEVWSCHKPK